MLLLSLLRPLLLIMFIPSTFRRRVSSWEALILFQAVDGIRDLTVTGVQTCALPIYPDGARRTARDARRVARPGAQRRRKRSAVGRASPNGGVAPKEGADPAEGAVAAVIAVTS